ncbi:unnamed protein product [Mycena citricolor]|uniref:Transfer RNA methyltransferase 82 n=1 Tax=Mycena citricolor TaxID=2018698 RepID=A0AAD2HZR1_9AGAR|nr:unnamed protein product [Mycena citricolor]
MSVYPYSQLLFAASTAVAITGPVIQVFNASLVASTSESSKSSQGGEDIVGGSDAGPIRMAAINDGATHLATAADDKNLRVWKIGASGLELLSARELPKRPTALKFTRDGQTILASDKFGDVFRLVAFASYRRYIIDFRDFSYTLEPVLIPEPLPEERQKSRAMLSHDNPSGGTLVLGHASFLTSFTLTADERFIVTADRDEHVRVSWYPEGHVVERYCLGHTKFVSAVHIPIFASSELVSGGGDSSLRVWDWMSGKLLREIPILDTIEPFIRVFPGKKSKSPEDDDGEGNADGKKKKKKGRKAKVKDRAAARENAILVDEQPEDDLEEEEKADGALDESSNEKVKVLVVQRIESLRTPEGGNYLVFSAVGATALFLHTGDSVQPFDFGLPVTDFNLASDGSIWVCLDVSWSEAGSTTSDALVRAVRVVDGRLVEVAMTDSHPLLVGLNSEISRIGATPAEIASLELYLPLIAMPKNTEDSSDPMDRTQFESSASKKEQARLKTKQAVERAAQNQGEEKEEPETKRARSQQDEDVAM